MLLKPVEEAPVPIMNAEQEMELEVVSTALHTDMNLKPVQEAPVPVMDAQPEMELEVVSKAHIYIQT